MTGLHGTVDLVLWRFDDLSRWAKKIHRGYVRWSYTPWGGTEEESYSGGSVHPQFKFLPNDSGVVCILSTSSKGGGSMDSANP